MKCPVVVIGLDAAEPKLIERWIGEGQLPNIDRLWKHGAHTRLKNYESYSAELPWTTFLTGCSPRKTGFWTPLEYDPNEYGIVARGAYAFDEFKPFFALGKSHRVIAFDVPQMRLCDDIHGSQVLAWGAHSPQTESISSPASLLDELTQQHGEHPALHKDNAELWQSADLDWSLEALKTGISRRVAICTDLMQREPWDMFVTVFGEPHSAGHMHWHLSQPDHPLYSHCREEGRDPLLDVYKSIDDAIGKICEAAPSSARIVVFSGHGMEANSVDSGSMFYLPELLHRYSFNGKAAIAKGRSGTPPAAEKIYGRQRHWTTEIWARKEDWNPLRRLARKYPGLARKYFPIEQVFGSGAGPAPPSSFSPEYNFIPAVWYSNLWPRMKVFALPSFSDGYVRVNLCGRDASGIVEPEDYDSVLDEVSVHLQQLTNARTGRPLVDKVIRTRSSATDSDPHLPDADMVVIWKSEPADVVDSESFGRIGPIPHRRGGSHTTDGFIVVDGPGISISSGKLRLGHVVDLAPTILDLMGAPIADQLDGTSLFSRDSDSIEQPAIFGTNDMKSTA